MIPPGEIKRRRKVIKELVREGAKCPECGAPLREQDIGFCIECEGVQFECPRCGTIGGLDPDPCICDFEDGGEE